MHGQKKRRKRHLSGIIEMEGMNLSWELVSEPQRSREHGYQGMQFSVRTEDQSHRELILAYPFPKTSLGKPLPFPQRPKFSEKTIESGIRKALAAGWNPVSRGKVFVHYLPEMSD
jgi:hypothetical protein